MKSKTIFLSILAGGALAFTLLAQTLQTTSDADVKAVNAFVQDLQTQQKTIADNQAKIDEKLAAVGEEMRLARIFISRGGK